MTFSISSLTSYFIGTSKNKWKSVAQNYGRLDAYFLSHVMQSQEHYYLTPLKLFAQIGGYIGLFRLTLFLLDLLEKMLNVSISSSSV